MELRRRHRSDPALRIGLAPHSVRAVPPEALTAVVAGLRQIDSTAPLHLHIAEQAAEVDQCLAWCGERPVAWLLDHAAVDQSWCLVHATHMSADETARLARTAAVAGLCPTTEANLGDGFFALLPFLEAKGRWGVGSDSHVSVSAIEELRWLEYGQRMQLRRRALAASAGSSTGKALWQGAASGGAQALGRRIGRIAVGCRADMLVLDPTAPSLYGRDCDTLIDSLVFASYSTAIRDVMVSGSWVVRDGRHRQEDRIAAAFRCAIDRLIAAPGL